MSRATVEITQVRITRPDLHVDLKKRMSREEFLKFSKLMAGGAPKIEGTIVNFGKVRAINIKVSAEAKQWNAGQAGWAVVKPFTVPDLAPGRTQFAYLRMNSVQQ